MRVEPFARLELGGAAVSVWQLHLSAPTDARLLSPDERARADRLVIPIVRQRFIAARAGLRLVLGDHTGVAPEALIFDYGAQGKPSLRHDRCHFNLSHAEDTALVAIAARPIGIDLEREQPMEGMSDVARLAFSPSEYAAWLALPADRQARAFYRTWTRKEALMKADGGGFRLSHTFSLPVTDAPQVMAVGEWIIDDVEVEPGFIAAVAVSVSPLTLPDL